MPERKLIVFDFDGTLVDSQFIFDVALEDFSSGKSLSWDIKKMAVGYVDPLKYDLGWGVALKDQPAIFHDFNIFMNERFRTDPRYMPVLFEHADTVLQELKEDYDLCIITARARESLLATLAYYNLSELFPNYRSLCCATDRGYPIKPMPDAVHCLLNDTKHLIENIVIVGDTTADIGMANAAGAKSIAALWGVHPAEKLQSANPTVMLDSITGLPDAIRRVFMHD